ncbi:MAG: class I SAM-dependent methyltransferase [Rhabdochlamydiaceae bacterium]|nr:class I SAM-dependent methyltransferase [Candidatus Amphrikana amoebophyrae]
MLSHFLAVAATLFIGSHSVEEAKSITLSSYDRTAKEYKSKNNGNFQPELMKPFMDHIRKGDQVLDLGCGPGLHVKELSKKGIEVCGIDYSPAMIKIAQHQAPKAKFYVMDIQSLSLQTKFNAVWASRSLHHIPREKLNGVLLNINKILTDGGVLYISMKKGTGEGVIADHYYEGVKKFYSYIAEDELVKELDLAGFDVILSEVKAINSSYNPQPHVIVLCKKRPAQNEQVS